MATNLRLTFRDAQARELTAAFPYASPSASGTKVRALMEGIIANGAIYASAPASIVGAELVTTVMTPIDLG